MPPSGRQRAALRKVDAVTEYIALWNRYFSFFSDEQSSIDDSAQAEFEFLQVVQALVLKHYPLVGLLHEHLDDGANILKLLQSNVSLGQIKTMADTEFDRMQVSWHEIFLQLCKVRGRLEHEIPVKVLEEYQATRQAA